MSDRFTAHGKQVLLDGEHYADAKDDTAAWLIADLLQRRLDGLEQTIASQPPPFGRTADLQPWNQPPRS